MSFETCRVHFTCITYVIQMNSYGFQLKFIFISYKCYMNFSWTSNESSYELHTNTWKFHTYFICSSYEIQLKFVWNSWQWLCNGYEAHTKSLWAISYKNLLYFIQMNFIRNLYEVHMNICQYYFMCTSYKMGIEVHRITLQLPKMLARQIYVVIQCPVCSPVKPLVDQLCNLEIKILYWCIEFQSCFVAFGRIRQQIRWVVFCLQYQKC